MADDDAAKKKEKPMTFASKHTSVTHSDFGLNLSILVVFRIKLVGYSTG
jgi:hypothetical protein